MIILLTITGIEEISNTKENNLPHKPVPFIILRKWERSIARGVAQQYTVAHVIGIVEISGSLDVCWSRNMYHDVHPPRAELIIRLEPLYGFFGLEYKIRVALVTKVQCIMWHTGRQECRFCGAHYPVGRQRNTHGRSLFMLPLEKLL